MDMRQLALPVEFVEFDFMKLFYIMKEEYHNRSELVEQWFNEGVFICQLKSVEILPLGPQLSMERWSWTEEEKHSHSLINDDYVLVQILHMMPLRLNGDDDAGLVVHEMVIVPW